MTDQMHYKRFGQSQKHILQSTIVIKNRIDTI